MANFVIQTVDGQIKDDFCFYLIQSIDYQNWLHPGAHGYVLAERLLEADFSSHVPCGSIQFVEEFIKVYHNKPAMKPINVPKELQTSEFLKRKYEVLPHDKIALSPAERFIKSQDKVKSYREITKNPGTLPEGFYAVSELILIDSEWRAFVFEGKLVGLKHYLGDFWRLPDREVLHQMIAAYTDCPPAYTLDVGVNEEGTFIIEAHNFYSCGMYGFDDGSVIPQMFIRSFRHLLSNGY